MYKVITPVAGRILNAYPQDLNLLVIQSNTYLGTTVKGL